MFVWLTVDNNQGLRYIINTILKMNNNQLPKTKIVRLFTTVETRTFTSMKHYIQR